MAQDPPAPSQCCVVDFQISGTLGFRPLQGQLKINGRVVCVCAVLD